MVHIIAFASINLFCLDRRLASCFQLSVFQRLTILQDRPFCLNSHQFPRASDVRWCEVDGCTIAWFGRPAFAYVRGPRDQDVAESLKGAEEIDQLWVLVSTHRMQIAPFHIRFTLFVHMMRVHDWWIFLNIDHMIELHIPCKLLVRDFSSEFVIHFDRRKTCWSKMASIQRTPAWNPTDS